MTMMTGIRTRLLVWIPVVVALIQSLLHLPIVSADDATDFSAHVFRNDRGETLPYRLLKPLSDDGNCSYPLVLYLHGAGECGDDNRKQLLNIAPVFAAPEMRRHYPCFVVAPQLPEDAKWVYMKWFDDNGGGAPAQPSRGIRMSLQLLDKLSGEFRIDRSRIYVTGISMGGHGTWDILWRKPGFFAAAVPICGGGDPGKASLITHTPIWAFHGRRDPIVPVERSRSMIKAIKKVGGNPRYTEYPNTGHDAWSQAYMEPELFKWMFTQRIVR